MSIDHVIKKFSAGPAGHGGRRQFIEAAITLEGRLSMAEARAPLTLAERYLLDSIGDPSSEPCDRHANFSVSFRPHGRLSFLPRKTYEDNKDHLHLVTHIDISSLGAEIHQTIERKVTETIEQDFRHIIEYQSVGTVLDMCRELKTAAAHMAPLVSYVGNRCFSNFYDVGKTGYPYETSIEQALQHVAQNGERSEPDHVVALYCLVMALKSGGYTRLEELNSTQLSLAGLHGFFDEKHRHYSDGTGGSRGRGFSDAPLADKAAILSDMRRSMAQEVRFIRKISGTNLSKKESFIKLAPFDARRRHDVSAPYGQEEHAVLRRALPGGGSIEDLSDRGLFGRLLERGHRDGDRDDRYQTGLEQMIDRVVEEAVEKTRSDFGMTRGARDFGRFIRAVGAGEADLVAGWTQNEYFCHVVPSAAMKGRLSRRNLLVMLNSISGRMRYNTWHYAPSYFPPKKIPAGRGWFMAPRMADLADHSDQHHTGHVHAEVKYSIRSPLPVHTTAGLLQGFIDLRLMRQHGVPYDEDDLRTAVRYTECLQRLYQRLADHLAEGDIDFRFSFGDKRWFEAAYAGDGRAMSGVVAMAG